MCYLSTSTKRKPILLSYVEATCIQWNQPIAQNLKPIKVGFTKLFAQNPWFYCFLIFLAPIPRSMLWHPWRSEDVPRDMIVLQESKEWNQKSKVDWLCSQKHAPMKTLWETKNWAPDSQRARLTGPFIPLSKADTSRNMIESKVDWTFHPSLKGRYIQEYDRNPSASASIHVQIA